MGVMYSVKCKCGFGAKYFSNGSKIDDSLKKELENKAKNGEFGEEIKNSFEKYPDGYLDQTMGLYVCDECGVSKAEHSLDFCRKVRQTGATLGERISVVEEYKHTCDKCGKEMRKITNKEVTNGATKCPKCGKEAAISGTNYWK